MSGCCRKYLDPGPQSPIEKSILVAEFGKLAAKVMWEIDLALAARGSRTEDDEMLQAWVLHLIGRIELSLWLHLVAVMGLVLAGCYPLICVLAVLPFTFFYLAALPEIWSLEVQAHNQGWFWVHTVTPFVVSWFLVLTHWVRFSARVKAIRDTWRSRRNFFFLRLFHYFPCFSLVFKNSSGLKCTKMCTMMNVLFLFFVFSVGEALQMLVVFSICFNVLTLP